MKITNILALVAVCLLASTGTVSAGAMTGFTNIGISSAVAGASVTVTLTFQPATTVPISPTAGKITLTMPRGYFLGTVSDITNAADTLTATSAPAATAASESIVLTIANLASGTSARTITLNGLTLGGARPVTTNGFTMSTSVDTTATAALQAPAVTGKITFTSITVGSTAQGATVTPVLVFNPAIDVVSGGTITLTMPAGYFRGTVSSIASSKTGLTATSTTPADALSTTIELTTGGAATGTATAITMTLTGLTLGTVQSATPAGFLIKSSATGDVISIGLDAAAITGMQFASIALAAQISAGASTSPVLTFTPATEVPIGGKITLTMPAGYFRGTVSSITNAADGLKATSSVAATATSTSIVLTTTDLASGTSARTITLIGLTLGGSRAQVNGGFKLSSSVDAGLSAGVDALAVTGAIRFSTITMATAVAGASVSPVLTFTPATDVPIGGTITLTMPAGYFRGTVTSITNTADGLKATSSVAATATSTSIALTTTDLASGTSARTITLIGLTLGGARDAVTAGFQLSTSAETTTPASVLDAPAVTGMVLTSVTMGATTASGASISPVLVFKPHNSVSAAGTITLTMPAGYFLGTATSLLASSVASLNATGSPAIHNSTTIVLTTAGAATGTAAITMTLTGLTLGSARAAVTAGFQLSSNADAGLSFGVNAPEITAAITAAPSTTKSSGMMMQVSGLLVLFVLAAFICY